MPRNEFGVYSQPDGTLAVAGETASASAYNTLMDDIGDALTASLTRDGNALWTNDQNANGFTIANLDEPTADDEAATKGYVDSFSNSVYSGGDTENLVYPIGTCLLVYTAATPSRNGALSVTIAAATEKFELGGAGATLTGTWRAKGAVAGAVLMQRTA